MQALAAKARQRLQGDALPEPEEKQLPLWPEAVRGVPNAVLRCSLFAATHQRDVCRRRELLASTADVEVRFLGVRFNQVDLNVWEMLLHLARLQPLGSEVRFAAHALLKALGRPTGNSQHEQLKEEIARLAGGMVEVTWKGGRRSFGGTLISEYYRDEEAQRYVVVLKPEILELFDCGYSHVDWGQRRALKSSLAQWLHGMYSSHASPYPYKVATLRDLCGSSTKALWKFRQLLRAALNELVAVGCIKGWKIDTADLVHVDIVPSASQAKHIRKARHSK